MTITDCVLHGSSSQQLLCPWYPLFGHPTPAVSVPGGTVRVTRSRPRS